MSFITAKLLTFELQTEPLKQNHSNLNDLVTHGSCAFDVVHILFVTHNNDVVTITL